MPDPYLESTKCREKFRRAAKRSQPAACSTCARSSFCGRRPSWDLWIAVLVGKAMIPFDGSAQARGRAASAWRKPQDRALMRIGFPKAEHDAPQRGRSAPSVPPLVAGEPRGGRRAPTAARLCAGGCVLSGPWVVGHPHPLRIPSVTVGRTVRRAGWRWVRVRPCVRVQLSYI